MHLMWRCLHTNKSLRLWNVTLSEKNTVLNAKPTANLHDSDDEMKVKISPSYSIECLNT